MSGDAASTTSWVSAMVAALISIGSAIVAYVRSATRSDVKIAELERRQTEIEDQIGRNVGETMAALREKLTQMEIWGRDNFVRRDVFMQSVESNNRSLDALGGKIDRLRESLEAKIDKLK